MTMGSILLLISVVCVFLVKGQDFPPCPPGFILTTECRNDCSSDAHCSTGNFCCRSDACSVRCLPRPKPGTCPRQGNQVTGRRCRTDVDCDGIEKCCDRSCTVPNTPRASSDAGSC